MTTTPTLTRIVATLGPASGDGDTLRRLIEAGVSIFRLNFSHGGPEEHAARVAAIRAAAAELDRPIAILGDLPGPKIRVAAVEGDAVEVATGATVRFHAQDAGSGGAPGAEASFAVTTPQLISDVEEGHRLLVNDGAVRMLVVEKGPASVRCTVTHGGLVSTGKGINVPDSDLRVATMTDANWRWTEWAVAHEVDFLALSFVRGPEDVRELKDGIEREATGQGRAGLRIPVIAKIERPRAVEHIGQIVQASDGVMVARGDLGVEMDLAAVPVIQRRILRAARSYGVPCIVATQMLETMIDRPVPTRAEASDVANAIFDGADAVMLSGETAVGQFPIVTVETMARIARSAEAYLAGQPSRSAPPEHLVRSHHPMAALAHGVWNVARDYAATCIVVWSQSGGGARHLSQNDFRIPVFAISSDERALRQMQLLRGVTPVRLDPPAEIGAFARAVDEHLVAAGLAEPGDRCVLVTGAPVAGAVETNSLITHTIGGIVSDAAGIVSDAGGAG